MCHKDKPLTDFYEQKTAKYGVRSYCKNCWHIYSKKYTKNSWQNTKTRYGEIKTKYGLGVGTIQRYGFKLALSVYERCNKCCVECNATNDLTLHHIDRKGRNYQENGLKPNNTEDNLIVLCRKCHGSIHGKQGRGISRTHKKREE